MNINNPSSANFPRSDSQGSTNSVMRRATNPTKVYHRRKQHRNCAGQTSTNTRISDGCQSVVSSEAQSLASKDHMTSEVAVKKRIINSFHGKEDLHREEMLRNDRSGPLDTCCLIDSCSSSKSNLDLDSGRLKTDMDDLGECSSSGDLASERLQDEMSERDICISILKKQRLFEKVSTVTASVSAQGVDVTRGNCNICKHPENTSKMIVCDNCENAFHLSCCNSHLKEVPEHEWFCESCLKPKTTVQEKHTGRVDGGSPLLGQGTAGGKSTSDEGSHGNASRQTNSEDESQGYANRESPAEDVSLGNASRESTSEDVSQGYTGRQSNFEDESQENASSESTSEDLLQGNASREATSEDNSQRNDSLDSRSEDEPQGDSSREATSEGNACLGSRSEDVSKGNASREATSEDDTQGNDCTDSTSKGEYQEGIDSASEEEMGPISLMLKSTESHMSNVRIGSKFQAEVPDWSGPVIEEVDPVGEPLEISTANCLHDLECKRSPRISSIANWVQCREAINGIGEGLDGTICGKWRRAPLFEVQTDDWECFRCILWDPYYADCAVPQEIDTDEVMTQLKYIDLLRPRLAAKRRKLNRSKTVDSQDLRKTWALRDTYHDSKDYLKVIGIHRSKWTKWRSL